MGPLPLVPFPLFPLFRLVGVLVVVVLVAPCVLVDMVVLSLRINCLSLDAALTGLGMVVGLVIV